MIALVARNLEHARSELEARRLDERETVFVTPGNIRSAVGCRFERVIWTAGWDDACSAERAVKVERVVAAGSAKR